MDTPHPRVFPVCLSPPRGRARLRLWVQAVCVLCSVPVIALNPCKSRKNSGILECSCGICFSGGFGSPPPRPDDWGVLQG